MHTSLILTCLKKGKFNIVGKKLGDLKWISDLLKIDRIRMLYEQALNLVIDYKQNKFN